MEANEKKEFDTLKAAHKAVEGENKKLKNSLEKSQAEVEALKTKSAIFQEDANKYKSTIAALEGDIKNITSEKSAAVQDVQRLTLERDNALSSIIELSAQVADQSTVKTEKDILVKVDGVKYLYERKSLHTINGEVTPEDAAKNMDFLRELIKTGAGNIRPA